MLLHSRCSVDVSFQADSGAYQTPSLLKGFEMGLGWVTLPGGWGQLLLVSSVPVHWVAKAGLVRQLSHCGMELAQIPCFAAHLSQESLRVSA